jgi:serine/threonine protein kinase
MLNIDYERGLKKLHDIVQRQKPEALNEFSLFQFRLLESLQDQQMYGYDPSNNAVRNRVLDQLIQFARQHFGIEFIDLCKPDKEPDALLPEEDAPTLPTHRRQERWTGGSEIFVKDVKYIIHEPVELKESSDKSALQQQARALQVETGRMAWLKQVQLRRATAVANAWKTALEKEGRLIITLEPHLPQKFPGYLDSESTTSAVTLVYSAVQGESWSQYFSPSAEPLNKRLTRTLLRSTVSLCDTLKPLHANRYAHRSLTPDKIFLTGGRTALLQDLGIATWQYELGEGPTLYRAPEQVNRGPLAPYTDVYQLGMLLYHFITGTIPTSAQQVLPLRTWNSELSAELDAVLQRAIAFNVNERWRNAADFSSALKRVL